MPKCLRTENVALVFMKAKKEDPGSYRPVNNTLIPERVMEQRIHEIIYKGQEGDDE